MNWVDLVVLVVLALSGLAGLVRGLVREVLGVAAWALALLVASPWGLYPAVAPFVRARIADPNVADPVAFVAVFLPALIILWLVARVVSGIVRRSAVGGLDRSVGLVFGVARGAVLVVAAYILGSVALPIDQWPAPVLRARATPFAYQGAVWTAGELPPRYRPTVNPPPGGKTSAAELLQANPVGRATARPARP